ncbi:GRIP domain-containing protein [Sphaerosporella brunnea]|uniref:GRIP domain-containing protein n=1 Tax=Sphaerosporella brunnea TaxID=1250544 RepID=A0A5J5EPQ2_9PEZI|nr:GRIP domain-containing protein [Sphaerosporella brunnea]
MQTVRAKAIDNEKPAFRTSVDSTRSSSRPMSPKPSITSSGVDMVYLKNVLLQFMELKDKNQQKQLIPALKMLLDLDSKEERKWMQVVQAR